MKCKENSMEIKCPICGITHSSGQREIFNMVYVDYNGKYQVSEYHRWVGGGSTCDCHSKLTYFQGG